MKAPKPPGAPIDMKRISGWLDDFANYRHSVTEQRIGRWLEQFDRKDRDLAARILDCVDFITSEKITASFAQALAEIPGWDSLAENREGQWRFAAFSSSAGESGDAMLQRFRHANNLASRKFNELFVHRSALLASGLSHGDTIVLVDDFSGSGQQAVDAWPMFAELLPDGADVHLVLIAATGDAVKRIQQETPLIVHADILLTKRDAVFDSACTRFTTVEKETLKKYCDRTVARSAKKYSSTGLVVVFAHTCPNNTLPILHAVTRDWEGLFRRYD